MRDSTFTQDILTEILKRLPAKSLVRFRCVSKFFCSLITDPLFADLHRNWSLTLPGRTSILVSLGPLLIHDVYYTINYNDEENNGNLRANRILYLDRKHWKYTRLESYANGLFCLSDLFDNNDSVVCNLSTRKHTLLPRISLLHYHLRSSRTRVGFDPISKRYKLLKSGMGQDHLGNTTWKLWVLTLGVDTSWREFNCINFYFPTEAFHLSYSGTSVYIDGVIYWSNLVPGFDIVAFDVGAENLRTISFPDDYSPISFPDDYSPLADVDGRLAIIQVSRVDTLYLQYNIELWSLEKSMKWGKCMTIPIPLEVDQMVYKRSLRLTTSHFGEIVLLIVTPESVHILLYELGRNIWRMFKKCGRDAFGISNLYIKSVHIIPENMFFP